MRFLSLLLFFLTAILNCQAQNQLSPQAGISILTCGPYQGELYSAFGHSAIRVHDPATGMDWLYNYGVFDFDQPNFYLNFARGYLHYKLAVMDYVRFRNYYISENRSIHEQVLNLNAADKQKYFDFLQWNAKPENQYYFYDYFYDNCATRVRDGLIRTFGDRIRFDGSYIKENKTIRDLTHIYLQQQPWGELGIDLCLGLPMDKRATPQMYMFLPDYIEKGFDHAYIKNGKEEEPLVEETIVTYSSKPEPDAGSTITPTIVSIFLLLIAVIISIIEKSNKKYFRWFDIIVFSLTGLLGWVFFMLWFATDHHAAARNFNLLWAIPFHFPIAFWLIKKYPPNWVKVYFIIVTIIIILLLISWNFLPQDLHESLLGLVFLLGLRSSLIVQRIAKQNPIAA